MAKWLTLIAMCLAFFIGNLDITAMNITVNAIHLQFDQPISLVEWILSGYLLGFAAVLIAAGRLSDIYTHRRVFLLGLALFGLFSLLGGLSINLTMLIICRVCQGMACAIMWPGIIALTLQTFPEEQKGIAMGWLLGAAGLAMASGPIVGGALVSYLSWHWVLLLNFPISIIAWGIAFWFIPRASVNSKSKKFDFFGCVLIIIASSSLVYSINRLEVHSLQGWTIYWLLLFIVALALFVWRQKKAESPLINLAVLNNRVFIGGLLIRIATMYTYLTLLFLLGLYFERVLKYSAIMTGLYFLPLMLTTAIVSPLMGRLVNRFGSIKPMLIGTLLVGFGIWLMTLQRDIHITYFSNGWRLFIIGLGLGIVFPCNNLVTVNALPKAFAGLASGLLYMFALIAGSIAIVISSVIAKNGALTLVYQNFLRMGIHLSAQQQHNLLQSVNALNLEAYLKANFPHNVIANLVPSVNHIYAFSFATSGLIAAILCLIAFIIMALFLINEPNNVK